MLEFVRKLNIGMTVLQAAANKLPPVVACQTFISCTVHVLVPCLKLYSS